jgi:hypothetical protein
VIIAAKTQQENADTTRRSKVGKILRLSALQFGTIKEIKNGLRDS